MNTEFLKKYKLLIIWGVPLLFVLGSLLLVLLSNKTINQTQTQPVTNQNLQTTPEFIKNNDTLNTNNNPGERNEDSIANRPGLQKKEVLPNNTVRYTFTSPVTERPNIIITRGVDDAIFQRLVTDPILPVKITDYTNSYGQPRWIFKGSNFYGPAAQSYIYPESGFAFIANPSTGEVLEQHIFTPTKVEEYIKKYGDDIPAQP